MAKENAVVDKFDELGRVKGGGSGGGSGAWSISVLRLAHKLEPRSTGVDRPGLKVSRHLVCRSHICLPIFKGRRADAKDKKKTS